MKINFDDFFNLNLNFVTLRLSYRKDSSVELQYKKSMDLVNQFEFNPWLDRLQDALEYAVFKNSKELLNLVHDDFQCYYQEKISKLID